MTRLFSIISLVLVLVLFPPAALALVSNNAVPGDRTYPIKRGLEDVIYAVASLHPATKAWFAAARSDRRFKEFTLLAASGKKTAEVLDELVEQTEIAAKQITSVSDQDQKEKLVQKLSESIKKYDQGLKQLSSSSVPVATTAPSAKLTPVPSTSTTLPDVQPTTNPTPTPLSVSTPHPTPTPSNQDDGRQRQIDEARQRLEEIMQRLREEQEQQRRQHQQERNFQPEEVIERQNQEDRNQKEQDKKEDQDNKRDEIKKEESKPEMKQKEEEKEKKETEKEKKKNQKNRS